MRNTHKTISESLKVLEQIKTLSDKHNRTLAVYLSMGFGNPRETHGVLISYRNGQINSLVWELKLFHFPTLLGKQYLRTSLIYTEDNTNISLCGVWCSFPTHIPKMDMKNSLLLTSQGAQRFDGYTWFWGCPMASDALVGNMPTEKLLTFFTEEGINFGYIRPLNLQ
ncbi:MAG: hypothetical protein CM15mP32_6340 [Flavobacteriaceae bacterium]|nr:MAG: hypothetical protein CM15mP32_6340 [Flavobacteriaceae bacterium]